MEVETWVDTDIEEKGRRNFMEEADNSKKKEPGTWMSFLVFGIAIAIILTGVVILEFDVHIVLLLALIFVCVVSATLGYSFDDLVEFMKKSLG